jgi:glutamate synthase domain-containing protein 2
MPEIAVIPRIVPETTVHSPARHSEVDTPEELVMFLQLFRMLSDGKPVGIKL